MKPVRKFKFVYDGKTHVLTGRFPRQAAEKAARMLPIDTEELIILKEVNRNWMKRRRFSYIASCTLQPKRVGDPEWLPAMIRIPKVRSAGIVKDER